MAKLKWKYDKKFKQWWIGESVPYAGDAMSIWKSDNGKKFSLKMEYPKAHLLFKRLLDAKKVAQLIYNG